MRSRIQLCGVAGALLFLVGCAAKPIVVPATSHQAVSVDQVKIYDAEPYKYEMLGNVELPMTPEMKFNAKGEYDPAMDALKAAAAAKGANGLLLKMDTSEINGLAGVQYHGKFYQVGARHTPDGKKILVGKAIYVVEETKK